MANLEASVLAEEAYQGRFDIDGYSSEVTFRLSAAADGILRIDFDPVKSQAYVAVAKAEGRPGESTKLSKLHGIGADGSEFSSESAYLHGGGSNEKGHHIRAVVYSGTVKQPLEKRVGRPRAIYWLRSFESFRNETIETPLGRLAVRGNTPPVAVDQISGLVALEKSSASDAETWRDAADAFLRHVQLGLSFAHGGRLQVPIIDYYAEQIRERTFIGGNGFRSEFRVQHALNHTPFIKALVNRYFEKGPLPDSLWTALGWMQVDTTIDEVRFLAAMTALEAIIEGELPEGRRTKVSKAEFNSLRGDIENIIAANNALSLDEKAFISGKLSDLNNRTFREKIEALFEHYKISRRDFDGAVLKDLIRLRNDIVHRGIVPEAVSDVMPSIILVRELITRILLSEIGFKGRYCCYVGTWNDRDFPEAEKTALQVVH